VIWYVVKVAPQMERRVGREVHRGLGLDWYVPVERREIVRSGRKAERCDPLIRGYVFVRDVAETVWHDLRAIRGVRGWLEADGVPAAVTDSEVARIRVLEAEFNAAARASRRSTTWRSGDRARVIAGPFVNMDVLLEVVRGRHVRVDSPVGPVWVPVGHLARPDGQPS